MFAFFGLLSGLIAIGSYIPYVNDTLRKKIQPERAAWLIWCVTAAIAVFTQLSEGGSWSVLYPAFDGIGCVVVFIFSVRYGVGKFKKRDYLALCIAVIGLIAWYITKNAIYALVLTICIDTVGSVLTSWKTFEYPNSETYYPWLLILASSLLAVASVGKFNAILLLYPTALTLSTVAILTAKYLGHKRSGGHPVIVATGPSLFTTTLPSEMIIGRPLWSRNPAIRGKITTLQVPIAHANAHIIAGEFFTGTHDPGFGNGTAMELMNGYLIHNVIPAQAGTYLFYIRAIDSKGAWSKPRVISLNVNEK